MRKKISLISDYLYFNLYRFIYYLFNIILFAFSTVTFVWCFPFYNTSARVTCSLYCFNIARYRLLATCCKIYKYVEMYKFI